MRFIVGILILTITSVILSTLFWVVLGNVYSRVPEGLVEYEGLSKSVSSGEYSYTFTFKVGSRDHSITVKTIEVYDNYTREYLHVKPDNVGTTPIWIVTGDITGVTSIIVKPSPQQGGIHLDKGKPIKIQVTLNTIKPLKKTLTFIFLINDDETLKTITKTIEIQ